MTERLTDVVNSINNIGDAFDEFKERNGKTLSGLQERLEVLEAKGSRPGKIGPESEETRESREHKRLFEAWLRSPRDSGARQKLGDFQTNTKSLSVGTPADGGYAVPEELLRRVELLQKKYSPVRDIVNVQRVGSSDFKMLVDINGVTSGWVSETGSRSATNTSQLREIVPTMGELYAYPSATNWSLEDIFFDATGWLQDQVARSFAIAEGTAVISGSGSSQPTGMLNTTPVTTADDAVSPRAAAAYQYVLGGDNSPAVLMVMR